MKSSLLKTPSPFQSPSDQPDWSHVPQSTRRSYLPAWNTCTKSALLNSPFRSASPYQVCLSSLDPDAVVF